MTVDAVEDRSLLGAIGLFRSAGPALGDVVVLDLGYNDASDPAVFRGRVDDAMTALAGVPRVIWLNQHDWGPGRAGMNAELAAAASRYPNLDVVDWNAEVAAHPEYVYADAIHLTPAGQPAMAAVVRDHFDRYVASLTPTTTAAPTSRSTADLRGVDRDRASFAARGGSSDGRVVTATSTTAPWPLVAVVVLLVVGGALSLLGRRQRRPSSSARSASGSVTGSRQAKCSHTYGGGLAVDGRAVGEERREVGADARRGDDPHRGREHAGCARTSTSASRAGARRRRRWRPRAAGGRQRSSASSRNANAVGCSPSTGARRASHRSARSAPCGVAGERGEAEEAVGGEGVLRRRGVVLEVLGAHDERLGVGAGGEEAAAFVVGEERRRDRRRRSGPRPSHATSSSSASVSSASSSAA